MTPEQQFQDTLTKMQRMVMAELQAPWEEAMLNLIKYGGAPVMIGVMPDCRIYMQVIAGINLETP